VTAAERDTEAATPDAPAGAPPRRGLLARLPFAGQTFADSTLQGLILVVFLLAVIGYFAATTEGFFTASNALNILVNSAVIGIVAIGQVLTIISGGFDLSVSGTVPLGSVVFAVMLNRGLGVLPALLVTMAAGAFTGLVNGTIIAKAGINPLITTLGTLSVAGGIALTISNGVQIPFEDPTKGVLANPSLFGVNNGVWLLLGLSILVFVLLRYTVFGRSLYAVGGNREAARLAGTRVDLVTIAVYVISGALAGLAGAILASQLLTGAGTAGSDSALQSIAAVILGGASLAGGVGGVPGTLTGVLILATLANGMAIKSVPSFYQTIATGVILLIAVGLSQIRRVVRER
jgi:ribose/xylose/arabinose/galactoside ABC-type transport system permease subunit